MRPAVTPYLPRWVFAMPGTGAVAQQLSWVAPTWPTSPRPQVSPPNRATQLRRGAHLKL